MKALEYLQSIYNDPLEEPRTRRQCAMACLPFESPKYEALAIADYRGGIGTRIEEARKRIEGLPAARAEGRLLEFVRGKEKGAAEAAPSEKPFRRI